MTPIVQRAVQTAAGALLFALAAPLTGSAQHSLEDPTPRSHRAVATSTPRSVATIALVTATHAPRSFSPARTLVIDTLVFAHTALRRQSIELVPAIERMGTASGDDVIARPLLAGAAADLRWARSRASVMQLLDRTASSLEAMCTDADGNRRRACRTLAIDLTAARAHLRAGRKPEAKRALNALAKHSDEAVHSGAFAAWEGTVIGETARYAIERM